LSESSSLFDLTSRVAVITGGAGLLGVRHARAIAGVGGIPVLADIRGQAAEERARDIAREFDVEAWGIAVDVTNLASVEALRSAVMKRHGRVDILINNAANNPKQEAANDGARSRLENFAVSQWEEDLAVGLTSAFLCSRVLGAEMARQRRGVIVNIASDLALIAPDQRLYRQNGLPEKSQPVKPVSYPVVKSALLGLTRYVATYWANEGVRCNALSPGGVYNEQPDSFVVRLSQLIPLGRMAHPDEYEGAIVFLCSDASSYMTGANLVMDGGRTCW
jgi:NAD(P)-dependent dehydrogenase (short-subunit alcohol dehydrogenase family)